MRVYRVEHKRGGHGPWNNPRRDNEGPASTLSSIGRFFPLPSMHCWTDNKGKYRNGVRNLYQLTKWFSKQACEDLHRHGFVVKVFETNRLYNEDDYQLMFWRPKGTRSVAIHSLLDIRHE